MDTGRSFFCAGQARLAQFICNYEMLLGADGTIFSFVAFKAASPCSVASPKPAAPTCAASAAAASVRV